MTVHQLFEKTALQPEDIKRLVDAHQRTLRALGLKDNDDPLMQLVAKRIIQIGQSGIRDPKQISELALRTFRDLCE
jgi:hypothetical protein